MTKKQTLGWVALIVLTGAIVCAGIYTESEIGKKAMTSGKKSPRSVEIEWVLESESAAALGCGNNIRCYAAALRVVEFQKCPMEFQEAWLDYVQKVRRLADIGFAENVVGAFKTAIQTAALSPGVAKTLDAARQPLENARDAWDKVELSAIEFGARLPQPKIIVGNPYE